ncbi:MAG: preprotein translocase subunit SecG [Clostridiales bacterium]|nr:preprotein translocase subunit SecG [Clostridiales bacterium]
MEILKIVLLVVDAIICLALVVLMLLQSDKTEGAGTVVTGSSSSDGYLNNNKDRSRDGVLRRLTILSGALFMIITYVLGLIYIVPKTEAPVEEPTTSQTETVEQIEPTTETTDAQ